MHPSLFCILYSDIDGRGGKLRVPNIQRAVVTLFICVTLKVTAVSLSAEQNFTYQPECGESVCVCVWRGEGLCVHTAHGKHLRTQQSSGKIKIANKWSYCPNVKKYFKYACIQHNPT